MADASPDALPGDVQREMTDRLLLQVDQFATAVARFKAEVQSTEEWLNRFREGIEGYSSRPKAPESGQFVDILQPSTKDR